MRSQRTSIFGLLFFILLVIALPFTVFIAQQQQNYTQKASGANTITIDTTSNAGPVNPLIWGIGAPAREIWDGDTGFTQRLKDANIKLVRIGAVQYSNLHLGGSTCTSPTSCNFSDMDKMIKAIFDGGAEPLYTIATYPGGIATDDWKNYATFMSLVVKHYNVDLAVGRKIQYWEMWNEPDNSVDEQLALSTYANFIKTVGSAMKAVDPTIKLVGPAAAYADLGQYTGGDGANGGYVNYAAQNTSDLLDILDWHNYARHDDTDQIRLDKEPGMYHDDVVNVLTNPLFVSSTGRHYGAAISEYNLAGQPPADGSGNTKFRNNYGAVFTASAFINALQAKASFFTYFLAAGPGDNLLGVMDPTNNWAPFTSYYSFYLFGNHLGNSANYLTTTGPSQSQRLEYVAAIDSNGQTVHVIVVNKDILNTQPVTLQLTNTSYASTYTRYTLNQSTLPTTGTQGTYSNGQISFTMQPTSIIAFDIPLTSQASTPSPTPASSNTATIAFSSPTTSSTIGIPFTANITINGGGQAFNAAQATVTVSPNLSISSVSLTPASSGGCNFTYTQTPTATNPSFAGAILSSSSPACTVYTLTLKPLSIGTGTITLSNTSIKAYSNNAEILGSVQNGSFVISQQPTNTPIPTQTPTVTPIPSPTPTPTLTSTPTPIPTGTPTPTPTLVPTSTPGPTLVTLQVPTISSVPTDTYQQSVTLAGTRDQLETAIYLNNASTGVRYPTSTTWQTTVSLPFGKNTISIYGKDNNGHQSATSTIAINIHKLGDIAGDGTIDLTDLSLFGADWGKCGSNLSNPLSDMSGDGCADLTSFSILAKQYGQ